MLKTEEKIVLIWMLKILLLTCKVQKLVIIKLQIKRIKENKVFQIYLYKIQKDPQ